jgi:hypothetical protein
VPRDGAIIFGDLIGKLGTLRIECAKCRRSGSGTPFFSGLLSSYTTQNDADPRRTELHRNEARHGLEYSSTEETTEASTAIFKSRASGDGRQGGGGLG